MRPYTIPLMERENQIRNLERRLRLFREIKAPWIEKPSKYEKEFASLIGAKVSPDSEFDIIIEGLRVELKKCKTGIWVNLVRYAEHVLKQSKLGEFTLFLFYDKDRITNIYGVDIERLIKLLDLDQNKAETIDRLNRSSRKQLNIQYPITKAEIRNIANFEVTYSQ